MSRIQKIFLKIMSGNSDKNIAFDDLTRLLNYLGFEVRIKGSHHIFRLKNKKEQINIQKDGSNAKAYQIKQIRRIIEENDIGDELK